MTRGQYIGWAIGVAFALLCGALLKIYVLDPQRDQARDASTSYKPPSLLSLPGNDVDAGLVLGHSRDDVRKLLGAPTESTDNTDAFRPGPGVTVKYAEGIATTIIIEWPEIARHERFARRWLHLAGDGPLAAGDLPLRVVTFVGHSERFGIEIASPLLTARPAPRAVAHRPLPAPAPASPRVDDLLREFPRIAAGVVQACDAVSRNASKVLSCPGFDGAVSYDLTSEDKTKSITVLDPSNARTEDDCRGILTQNRSELVPGVRVDGREGRSVMRFTSAGFDAQYVWLAPNGFRKTPSCSVMVCDKSAAGGRNSCTR